MFLLVLTVFFSHFLFGFNAKPAESGVLFRFHLSLFNVNKSVTKVQTFIYADNTAFTERLLYVVFIHTVRASRTIHFSITILLKPEVPMIFLSHDKIEYVCYL